MMTVLMVAFAMIATACGSGSSVDTVLNVNEDLSGTRTMTVAINSSVFGKYFNGSTDDLANLISSTCPSELEWSRDNSTGDEVYTFNLNFSDPADYKAKVESILGTEVTLDIQSPDSIWANGAYVEESFTSIELLDWLKQAVITAGYVSSDNSGNIFSNGDTEVNFNGISKSTGSTIYMNEIEYIQLNSISILTDVADIDKYTTLVKIDVPAASMNAKGTEIKEFMQNATPSGASLDEDTSAGTGSVFKISCPETDIAGMEAQLKAVFGEENVYFENDKVEADSTPFILGVRQIVHINYSNFVAGNEQSVTYRYSIKLPDNYDHASWEEDADNSGYYLIQSGHAYGEEVDFYIDFAKTYVLSKIDVVTSRSMTGKLSKSTTFTITNSVSEEDLTRIVSAFEDRAKTAGDSYDKLVESRKESEEEEATAEESVEAEAEPATEAAEESTEAADAASSEASEESADTEETKNSLDITVSSGESDGHTTITILQKGNAEQLYVGGSYLYSMDNDVSYSKAKGFAKISKKCAVTDKLDYRIVAPNVTNDFVMNYTLKLSGMNKMIYTNLDQTNIVSKKGGKLEAKFIQTTSADIEWYGSYVDIFAVLFWLLMVAGVVLIVVAIFKSGLIQFKKAQPAMNQGQAFVNPQNAAYTQASVNAQAPVNAQPVETTPVNAQPVEAVSANAQPVEEAPAVERNSDSVDLSKTAEEAPKMTPKFCPGCGKELEENAVFCTSCGTKL